MSDPFETSIIVRCSPAHAFEVFVEKIDVWWPRSHRRPHAAMVLERGVKGRFLQRLEDGTEIELGEVVAWDPPDHLSYTWLPGASDPTLVEITFTGVDDGTRVDITHSAGAVDDDEWPAKVGVYAQRWPEVLEQFRTTAEKEPR